VSWVSLVVWIATAGVGIAMAALWLERGGMRQARHPHSVHAGRLAIHAGLAVSGLLLWVVYLITESHTLAWISFGVLVVVGILGATAFRIWQRRRLGFVKATQDDWNWPPEAMAKSEGVPAEQHLPASVVLLHGVLAIATVVLVLLTSLRVGNGESGAQARAPITLGAPTQATRTNSAEGPRHGQSYRSQLTLGGVYHVYDNGQRVFVANSAIVPAEEGGATREDVERLQRWALRVRRARARGQTLQPTPAVRAATKRFYGEP
jgi:manganese efflux pump family protein